MIVCYYIKRVASSFSYIFLFNKNILTFAWSKIEILIDFEKVVFSFFKTYYEFKKQNEPLFVY